MVEGEQAGAGGLEDGDAGRAQAGRGVGVDRGRDRGEDDNRLGGRGGDGQDGVAVGVVTVELGDQVDRQRDRADVGVVGEGRQRLGEQVLGVAPGPPDVERVAGFEAGVEHRRQPVPGLVGQLGERDTDRGRHVGDVRPLEAGVVHGGESPNGPAGWPSGGGGPVGAAPGATAGAEQLERVRQLGQVADAVHAVGGRQRLPGAVAGREGAGVGGDQGPAGGRGAGRQQHDRNVAGGGVGEDRTEQGPVPDRLEDEREDPRLRERERVPGVGGGGGDELLPGRNRDRETERPAGPQQGREHRARVRDQPDRPGRERVGLGVADRPQPARHVHEPHAAGAAHRHPRGPRGRRDPVPKPGPAGVDGVDGRTEDDRRAHARFGRHLQLLLEGGVGHGEQGQVHRLGEIGQRRVAARAADLLIARVDEVLARRAGRLRDLLDHPRAEAPGPGRRANQRDAPGLEHDRERIGGGPVHAVIHILNFYLRRARAVLRRSAMAALAACMPGMPQTPPPAWVAELAL